MTFKKFSAKFKVNLGNSTKSELLQKNFFQMFVAGTFYLNVILIVAPCNQNLYKCLHGGSHISRNSIVSKANPT